ncbi:uncharacterized protein LOC109841739 [Asparagus officinalis]|uniref:uncharacterized protein LOC109841739 n=1 Tax=Asparagus officinalis TaxID=4686 RepID=UPI00098E053C|nr:uncharacterized protein LOC109841739 [Asparagus officinalis]
MSAINTNGKIGSWIMSKRGVRQGDPLSPLLFVLAADAFTSMLNLAAEASLIERLGPINMSQKVCCLQYADDTLVFCKNKRKQLTVLKLILYCFELASGLKINFNKSLLIALEDNEILQHNLAGMLNCKSGSFPITYLGVPLRPGWLIDKIDMMRRRFLWTGSLEHKNSSNLVKCEEICRPKKLGGLGIINLRTMNKALLGKWIWKWFDDKMDLWKQISFYKYFENKNCTCVDVGNGNKTLYWLDKWTCANTLASMLPSLYNIASFSYATITSSQISDRAARLQERRRKKAASVAGISSVCTAGRVIDLLE